MLSKHLGAEAPQKNWKQLWPKPPLLPGVCPRSGLLYRCVVTRQSYRIFVAIIGISKKDGHGHGH